MAKQMIFRMSNIINMYVLLTSNQIHPKLNTFIMEIHIEDDRQNSWSKGQKKQDLSQIKPSFDDLKEFFQSLSTHVYQNKNHIIFDFVKKVCYKFYEDNVSADETLSNEIITTETIENYANLNTLKRKSPYTQKDDKRILQKLRAKFEVSQPRTFARALAARSFLKNGYNYKLFMQYITENDLNFALEQRFKSAKSYRYLSNSFLITTYRMAEKCRKRMKKEALITGEKILQKMATSILRHCRWTLKENNCKTFLLLVIQKFNFAKVQYQNIQIQELMFECFELSNQISKFSKSDLIQKLMTRKDMKQNNLQIIKELKLKYQDNNQVNNKDKNETFLTLWSNEIDEQLIKQYLKNSQINHLTVQMRTNFPNIHFNQTIILLRLNDLQIQNLYLIKEMSKVEQNQLPQMIDLSDQIIKSFKALEISSDIKLGLSYFKVDCGRNMVQNLILGFNHIAVEKQW